MPVTVMIAIGKPKAMPTRGGRRSLLSQERMNSELGIGSTTLGSGMMV